MRSCPELSLSSSKGWIPFVVFTATMETRRFGLYGEYFPASAAIGFWSQHPRRPQFLTPRPPWTLSGFDFCLQEVDLSPTEFLVCLLSCMPAYYPKLSRRRRGGLTPSKIKNASVRSNTLRSQAILLTSERNSIPSGISSPELSQCRQFVTVASIIPPKKRPRRGTD